MTLQVPLARSFVHMCESLKLESLHIEELLLAVLEMPLTPAPSSLALPSFRGSLCLELNKLLEPGEG